MRSAFCSCKRKLKLEELCSGELLEAVNDLLKLKKDLSDLTNNKFFKAETVVMQLVKVQELLIATGYTKGSSKRRQILQSVEDRLETTAQTLNKKLNLTAS